MSRTLRDADNFDVGTFDGSMWEFCREVLLRNNDDISMAESVIGSFPNGNFRERLLDELVLTIKDDGLLLETIQLILNRIEGHTGDFLSQALDMVLYAYSQSPSITKDSPETEEAVAVERILESMVEQSKMLRSLTTSDL